MTPSHVTALCHCFISMPTPSESSSMGSSTPDLSVAGTASSSSTSSMGSALPSSAALAGFMSRWAADEGLAGASAVATAGGVAIRGSTPEGATTVGAVACGATVSAAGARLFVLFESAGSFSQANPTAAAANISKGNRIDLSSSCQPSRRTMQQGTRSTSRAIECEAHIVSKEPKRPSISAAMTSFTTPMCRVCALVDAGFALPHVRIGKSRWLIPSRRARRAERDGRAVSGRKGSRALMVPEGTPSAR
jgi:hypothetical protein